MRVLVVDDEYLARRRVITLLKEYSEDFEILEASSGSEAVWSINTLRPQLIFLDIQMTDMNGFEVLKNVTLKEVPPVIFVTAFDHYAIQAFDIQAVDYLLKPYKNIRFFEALERSLQHGRTLQITELLSTLQQLKRLDTDSKEDYLKKLVVKKNKKYIFIPVEAIKYILSSSYYAEVYTIDQKKHLIRTSLSSLMEQLNPSKFTRINRSSIINLAELKEVESEGGGEYAIKMNDGKLLSLTSSFKSEFLKKVNIA